MKAKRIFSKRKNVWVWQMEGWLGGTQIRRGQFPTKKECDAAIAVMELRSRARTHGTPIPASDVTIIELFERIEERLDGMAKTLKIFNVHIGNIDSQLARITAESDLIDERIAKLESPQ